MVHSTIKAGDRVRFIRADGTLSEEAVEVIDTFADTKASANFSYLVGGHEELHHSDLVHLDGDTSPVTVPPTEEWFIAVGNACGWGRARTEKQAIANMRSQSKPTEYIVYSVNKWTRVNGMGGLTHPMGRGEPKKVKHVLPKLPG
jgi:hypothetical protein